MLKFIRVIHAIVGLAIIVVLIVVRASVAHPDRMARSSRDKCIQHPITFLAHGIVLASSNEARRISGRRSLSDLSLLSRPMPTQAVTGRSILVISALCGQFP